MSARLHAVSNDARPAVEVHALRKTYPGGVEAVRGIDFQVAPGEVFGLLGPNGAGKSTTIRILLGPLRADAGTARLLGGDPWRDVTALDRRLAYVPGDVTLWPDLSGGEVIDLLGRLRGGLDPKRRARLLERFDLDPTKKGRAYSKGNRQKVALVAALASDVELLILDEPTSGLDPLMEAALLLGWVIGFAVLGAALGGAANSVGSLASDNPQIIDLLNRMGGRKDLTDTYLTVALTVTGIVAAAYGVQSAVITVLLIGEFGALLRLPGWVMDASPFTHVPKVPGAELTVTPLAWLSAIAVALTAAGLIGLRRRDIG
jgi:ABC-type branched-subunit amino acid transport system ATPase component